jgi:hypothetical protein
MSAQPVDVLAVMDGAIQTFCSSNFTDRYRQGPDMREARAAVAELIEADREYDEAKSNFWKGPAAAAVYHLSLARRRAALARCAGSPT